MLNQYVITTLLVRSIGKHSGHRNSRLGSVLFIKVETPSRVKSICDTHYAIFVTKVTKALLYNISRLSLQSTGFKYPMLFHLRLAFRLICVVSFPPKSLLSTAAISSIYVLFKDDHMTRLFLSN
jgi:hypothetical protein